MCGIVGYVGDRRAAPLLLERLRRLEYRGYDSAGICTIAEGGFHAVRRKGRIREIACAESLPGTVGIAHTRWATHGAPCEKNAHPHLCGKFALVHNGIVENDGALRASLLRQGAELKSQTDSELIVQMLDREYDGDPMQTLVRVLRRVKGSYALGVLCLDCPGVLFAARRKSPLLVGVGEGECLLASDLPALASEGMQAYILEDGELAALRADGAEFYGADGKRIQKKPHCTVPREEIPSKGRYPHYMCKEMAEIPLAIRQSLCDLRQNHTFNDVCEVLCQTDYVEIVACGTAYHAGLAAKYAFERLAGIRTDVYLAGEYRDGLPDCTGGECLTIALSQSGETADTIAAASLAKQRGKTLLCITNAPYSTLSSMGDRALVTRAGREIAVAATKSYQAQLAVLYALSLGAARARGRNVDKEYAALERLPDDCRILLSRLGRIGGWAERFRGARSVYFIGKGADHAAAVEGSLKLKELSYIPSEGYAAGELKHGTLSLVDTRTPVVAILTQRQLAARLMNAVSEVASRGARVFLVTSFPEFCARREVISSVVLPETSPLFTPALSVIPLQALAYETALALGNDPDKPRNLAKSVTVE